MPPKVQLVTGSSFITGIGYDPESEVLTITFKDGQSYSYDGVDEGTYQEFAAANSMGKFWHARIKDSFNSRRA